MSPLSLAVVISLILLGIGVLLVISAAIVPSNRALVITAATWVTIAFVATVISVVLHHLATRKFIEMLSANQANEWKYRIDERSNESVRIETVLNDLPNLTRYDHFPYYDDYVSNSLRQTAADFVVGVRPGNSVADASGVWRRIIEERKIDDKAGNFAADANGNLRRIYKQR